MERQFVATGATVEEAIENACKELGVSPEDVTPEILRFPKKGFLGLGKVTAEVRVTVPGEDEIKKMPDTQPSKMPAVPSDKPIIAATKAEDASPAAPVREKPPVPEKPVPAPAAEKKEPVIPAKPVPAESAETVKEEASLEELQPKMDVAREYLSAIFEKMGIHDIQLRMEPAENRTVLIHLEGADIGSVIGKRGETLDAMQYLVSLAANRSEGDYVRFTINAGNYREKREETLRALAQRMARKVLKTGRPVALEPMNPYERRIIHAVVTDMEGVFSKSTGEEPNRKVVIKPVGKPSGNRRDSGKRSRGGRPPRNGGDAPHAQETAAAAEIPAQQPAPAETAEKKPVLDDNVKLYSKIEL